MKVLSLYISPESNNIIRSGNGISPRPYLDRDLYNRHMEIMKSRNTLSLQHYVNTLTQQLIP
jgi:hypothetical protein